MVLAGYSKLSYRSSGLAIVEDMKRLCPNAWLINFANPSGMVTEAVIRYGKWDKVIGLCNVPVMAMMTEPTMLGKKRRADLQVCRSKSLPLAQSSR